MTREQLWGIIGNIDDRFIAEAAQYDPKKCSRSPERNVIMKTKRIITLAIAAALILAMSIAAYAAYGAVSSPEAAEKVALAQIEEWKKLGILSPELSFEGHADNIFEFPEKDGGSYWYGRIFRHHYDVRWFFRRDGSHKYGCNIGVDTLSGKITAATLYAVPDETDTPVDETTIQGENGQDVVWYYYDNYDDIIPADMTLDQLCALLAGYWGFSGYRLGNVSDTADSGNQAQPDGSTLLTDIPKVYGRGAYVNVFFDGDPDGAPMYIELDQFPGHTCVIIGTNHAVG